MKIKTVGTRIKVDIEIPTAGALNTSSVKVAKEVGEITGVGEDVALPVKVGDRIMFKSWGVDIINHEGKDHYFIDENTGAICAILK
jgi:co-chaperonin GroES (HSP10)